jgi:predicted nucleotide-binding protein
MPARVFIGSSTESLPIAKRMQTLLSSRDFVVTVWDTYFASPGEFHLDNPIKAPDEFDFALFIFAPDDIAYIRANKVSVVRDNVIFEAGIFIKSLGRERTFIVLPKPDGGEEIHVLSDFLGLNLIHYHEIGQPNEWDARLGPACNSVQDRIRQLVAKVPERAAALWGSWIGEMHQAYGPDGILQTFIAKAEFGFSVGAVAGVLTVEGNIASEVNQIRVIP